MRLAIAMFSVTLAFTSGALAEGKAKTAASVEPIAQAEVLAPERKAAGQAATKGRAALKKQVKAASAKLGRITKSKRPVESAAVTEVRTLHDEALAQQGALQTLVKAQRTTEDALLKLVALADQKSQDAAQRAQAAREAAALAQKDAAAAKRDAQRVKALAGLGNVSTLPARRSKEDTELATLQKELDAVKQGLAPLQQAAAAAGATAPNDAKAQPKPAGACPQFLDDNDQADALDALKQCDIKTVDWSCYLTGVGQDGGSGGTTYTESHVLGVEYGDTNANGKPEAFVRVRETMELVLRDENGEDGDSMGKNTTWYVAVFEADAQCMVKRVGHIEEDEKPKGKLVVNGYDTQTKRQGKAIYRWLKGRLELSK